ncbi:MAG: plastocyanin/azurin family copper-binding protein [Gemmatimonadota bacterium]
MLRAIARAVTAGFAAATLLACGSLSTAPNNQPGTVTATSSLQFTPPTVTVTRTSGTAVVTWVFQSTVHNVTWDTQPSGAAVANIGNTSGASVAREFSVAGSYTYHCTIHPAMTGTAVVQ